MPITVEGNGRISIANTSPSAQNLHVGSTPWGGSINGYTRLAVEATDYAVVTIKSTSTNFSQIIFTDPTTTNLGGINYFNSSYATPNAMTFLTSATERMRINTYGIGLGGTAASSGMGIAFPASQSASTDPNTLDDYEEGTFTPNVIHASSNNSTWGTKQGYYRKIGTLLTCWVYCDGGNSGTAGTNLQVTSLPFTLLSGPSGAMTGGIWAANGLAANNGDLKPQGGTTTSNVYIGGGVVTSQCTYFSCCLTFMTSA